MEDLGKNRASLDDPHGLVKEVSGIQTPSMIEGIVVK
jgi:hypothetical protein